MTTTNAAANEIIFKDTKNGTRAYCYSRPMMRWMPIKFAVAIEMLRKGEAYDNTAYHAAEAVKAAKMESAFRAASAAARNGVTLRIVK